MTMLPDDGLNDPPPPLGWSYVVILLFAAALTYLMIRFDGCGATW